MDTIQEVVTEAMQTSQEILTLVAHDQHEEANKLILSLNELKCRTTLYALAKLFAEIVEMMSENEEDKQDVLTQIALMNTLATEGHFHHD